MQGVSGGEIIGAEAKVVFVFAKVIGLGVILEPGQFDLAAGMSVVQENDLKAAITGGFAAADRKSERFFIEGNRFIEVFDIEVGVDILENPRWPPVCYFCDIVS